MYTVGRKLAYGQSDAAVEIVKGHPYIALGAVRKLRKHVFAYF